MCNKYLIGVIAISNFYLSYMKSGRMWKHYIKRFFFNCRYSHSSKPPQHRCPSCNFGAKTKSALKSHLLVHDDDAHLTCQHCSSFACKRPSELKRHLRLKHGGSKSESILKCPGKKMCIEIIFLVSLIQRWYFVIPNRWSIPYHKFVRRKARFSKLRLSMASWHFTNLII